MSVTEIFMYLLLLIQEMLKKSNEFMNIVSLWQSIFVYHFPILSINNSFISREALRVNGTVTGEHGIGLGKKGLLIEEFGPSGINTMKAIKQALDPLNILNPGKVI